MTFFAYIILFIHCRRPLNLKFLSTALIGLFTIGLFLDRSIKKECWYVSTLNPEDIGTAAPQEVGLADVAMGLKKYILPADSYFLTIGLPSPGQSLV